MKLLRLISVIIIFVLFMGLCLPKLSAIAAVSPPKPYMVSDISPGTGGSEPGSLVAFQNKLIFIANDNTHGWEWWSTDGNENQTQLLFDLVPGSGTNLYFSNIKTIVSNNKLFFTAIDQDYGSEIWVSNGTQVGTNMIKDLNPGPANTSPDILLDFKNEVYFIGQKNVDTSSLLWKTDGTENGTVLIHELSCKSCYRYYRDFNINNETLFFTVNYWDDTSGNPEGFDLMKTDGSIGGTELVKTLHPTHHWQNRMASLNGLTFFTFGPGSIYQTLYQSDGTETGTKVVFSANDDSTDLYLTPVGDWLYFGAYDDDYYYAIFRTQGIGTTQRVRNFLSPSADQEARYLLNYNGKLLFSVNDGSGRHLWISDGTAGGTVELLSTTEYEDSSLMTVYRGKVYFTALDDTHGRELWVTDGTPAGTKLMEDILPGIESSDPQNLTVASGKLYFTANDGTHGIELWAYNPYPYSMFVPAVVK